MEEQLQNQNINNKDLDRENGKDSKLERVFDLAWITLYQAPSNDNIEKLQGKYRGLQSMIMKDATKMKGEDATEYQIKSLKLLDIMYEELVDNGFKKMAEEQGLSKAETKILLREKIFGVKDKEAPKQKVLQGTIKEQQENKGKEQKIEDGVTQEVNQNNQTGQNVIDFEKMYSPSVIANLENGDKYVVFQQDKIPAKVEQQLGDKRIVLTYIGKLKYCNAFGLRTYVDKYSLLIFSFKNGEPQTLQKDVYGDIDYGMIREKKEYRKAVFEQLLALENVDRKGNEGYIGGIYSTKTENKYKVYYSAEQYSAIRVYKEQTQRKLQETLEEFKGEEK